MSRLLLRICLLQLLFFFTSMTPVLAETKVLVIPKGSQASFWKHLAKGALQAGEEFGLTVVIRGPKAEDQHNAQVHIVKYGIQQKFAAIILAPNHENITAPILAQAVTQGIRIVLVDSDMTSDFHSGLVASNNGRAGRMAANYIASLLDNSGKVILARHIEGHSSTMEREKAFLDTLASNYPQIIVVADPYVGASRGEAYHTVSALLKAQQVDAIFCDSEEASLGILLALSEKPSQNKPKFIGFDFNETFRQAILSGEMSGTVIQNPYQMGYQGVTMAHRLLNNEEVSANTFTDVLLITSKNIESLEVQELVKQYLSPQAPGG